MVGLSFQDRRRFNLRPTFLRPSSCTDHPPSVAACWKHRAEHGARDPAGRRRRRRHGHRRPLPSGHRPWHGAPPSLRHQAERGRPHLRLLQAQEHRSVPRSRKLSFPFALSFGWSISVARAGVEVEGVRVEEAFFRGRKLQGATLALPDGYRGEAQFVASAFI